MVPEGNDGSGAWTRGYLQIRGSGDVRDLFCYQPATGGHLSGVMVQNRSLAYRGNLVVRCVPRGSVWNITLSDVFYKPPPPAWPLWSPLREPLSRERELVLR